MAKTNLVSSLFDKHHQFEVAILCTYGLDLNFFENYLLNLSALPPCDQITLFVDQSTYDGFIDSSYAPRWLNRRYLVTPVKTRGVFHTKLYILASEKKALIGLGSPNLTRDGIASNLELLSIFEVSKSKQEFAQLLVECISYVQRIAQKTESKQAIEHADYLGVLCSPYIADAQGCKLSFVHNLDRSLLTEIKEAIGRDRIDRIRVLSPFYDSQLKPLQMLQTELPDCQFEIFLQQKKSNFPLETANRLAGSTAVSLYKGIDRYLHGKAILLHRGNEIYLYKGSANFTNPALLQTAENGNYEIGVVGPIGQEMVKEILQPAGHEAQSISDLDEIETGEDDEFETRSTAQLDYLIEAFLNDNQIIYRTKTDIEPSLLQPQRYLLLDFFDNFVEGELSTGNVIDLPSKLRKKLSGGYTLQILGENNQGDLVFTNRVWVIDLEERTGDQRQRRMRRIFNDPGQLFYILEEIAKEGDERELMLFLQTFDIPLDLVLPPRTSRSVRHIGTKGNIIGSLPTHKSKFFSDTILTAYDDCLNRLLRKMQRHLENIQFDKISNFLLLYNSTQTLLHFINTWARDRYLPMQTISGDDWVTIRDCYDMLLKYSNSLWDIVWSKDGYRNAVNARFAESIDDEDDERENFDQYLLLDYGKSADEFIKFTMVPLQTFEELRSQLLVKTVGGKLATPKVFANRHLYLEQSELERLTVVLSVDTPRLLQTTWQG